LQKVTHWKEYPHMRPEQHGDEQGAPGTPHPPPSGGGEPESGGGFGQQALFGCPQLSTQGAEQPLGVQHWLLKHSWLPGHPIGQGTVSPQVVMEVMHLPAQAELSGVQQVPVVSLQ
jgi:hypothetical protein